MKKIMILFAFLLSCICGMSQQKIAGRYDDQKKIFFGKAFTSDEHQYVIEYLANNFVNGLAVVEKKIIYDNGGAGHKNYGLIDTAGKVYIPCVYESLDRLVNSRYYNYGNKDSTGIIDRNNRVIVSVKKTSEKYDRTSYVTRQSSVDVKSVVIVQSKCAGIFSLEEEKTILAPAYKNIVFSERFAICEGKGVVYGFEPGDYDLYAFSPLFTDMRKDSAFLFDLETHKRSVAFAEIHLFHNDSMVVVKTLNGSWKIYSDLFKALPVDRIKDPIVQYHNGRMIALRNDRYGVIDINGNEVIPFQYDNIYFLDEGYAWVKKNGWWAITNFQNHFKTGFDFLDIDSLNQVSLANYLYLTRIDTTQKLYSKDPGYFGFDIKHVYHTLGMPPALEKKLNDHIITRYSNYYAKKTDGYHLITVPKYTGPKDSITIDPAAWTNIYLVPSELGSTRDAHCVGVQQGKYFGIIGKDKGFKNQNIIYLPGESSPFAIVRHGRVYCQVSNGWDKYMDWTRYGKYKYYHEKEYILRY